MAQLKEATESHQMGRSVGDVEPVVALAPVTPPKNNRKRKQDQDNADRTAPARKRKTAVDASVPVSNGTAANGAQHDEDDDDDVMVMGEDSPKGNTSMALVEASLVLIEDIDVVFTEDKGFWPAVSKLLRTTKKPFIFTSNGVGKIE